MRPANKSNYNIAIRSLVQYHLGMTGGYNLAALLASYLGQQLIDLPLTEDFKMGIGLIQQQDRS